MVLSHLGAAFINELCSLIADHPAIPWWGTCATLEDAQHSLLGTPFVVVHSVLHHSVTVLLATFILLPPLTVSFLNGTLILFQQTLLWQALRLL